MEGGSFPSFFEEQIAAFLSCLLKARVGFFSLSLFPPYQDGRCIANRKRGRKRGGRKRERKINRAKMRAAKSDFFLRIMPFLFLRAILFFIFLIPPMLNFWQSSKKNPQKGDFLRATKAAFIAVSLSLFSGVEAYSKENVLLLPFYLFVLGLFTPKAIAYNRISCGPQRID